VDARRDRDVPAVDLQVDTGSDGPAGDKKDFVTQGSTPRDVLRQCGDAVCVKVPVSHGEG
jgi:hypothetical protein